jgi:hypothetical protein
MFEKLPLYALHTCCLFGCNFRLVSIQHRLRIRGSLIRRKLKLRYDLHVPWIRLDSASDE